MGDPSSRTGGFDSSDDPSVTDVAGPSITRDRTPELERGMVIGARYQVEAIIGRGGSGVVLRAFDRTAQAVVAVKVLKPELVHDQRWSKRFARELRLGRPIRHPNVCRIFDIGEGDGHRFLTMELATGGTLRDLIKKGESLRPLPERLADAAAAIAGLAAIHEAGIVHRDVKPDNMLRMDDGRLVLSDFGLATDLPTEAGVTVMVGTPHYMAPEVRAGEPATTRSDVWSLGVVLYEIFFGKRPERRSSMSSEGMSKPPAPLTSTPTERAMLALCERCLAENPIERPPDAGAVLRLFEAAQSSPRRFVHRRRLVSAAIVGVALAFGGAMLSKRLHRASGAPQTERSTDLPRLTPIGDAADWSKLATTIGTFYGRVHCFSMLDVGTAQIVWGSPKRAENIDLVSGRRVAADLLPETYSLGCPDRSPRGDALLFAANNRAGVGEIRLSKRSDGGDAVAVTPGADPRWLPNGEEFLYGVDSKHIAVFSLPTMRFNLLSAPGPGGDGMVLEKAAGPTSGTAGALIYGSNGERLLAIWDLTNLVWQKTFIASSAYELQYDPRDEGILLSYQRSRSDSTLISLNWRNGIARRLGRYPDFDIVHADLRPQRRIVLARRKTSDAWLYDEIGRHRLTESGDVYSAARSRSGDLLFGRRAGEGDFAIWLRRGSELKRLTPGPKDAAPDFGPDEKTWAYADYARGTIELCGPTGAGTSCRTIVKDRRLPSFPRFSPDGKKVAFITQVAPSRLGIVSLADGATRDLGPVYWQCPPIWTSPVSVWTIDGSAGRLTWSERDAVTGSKTGSRAPVSVALEASDDTRCVPADARRDSPFFPRLRIETEEQTLLLRLDQRATMP